MMRRLAGIILMFVSFLSAFAQVKYEAAIDLINLIDDKATVELRVPSFKKKTVVYQLPNIVPGSYELYNFTRYIDEFHAYSASGIKLPVKKNKKGQFVIKNADKLEKIVYTINDTWDDTTSASNHVFQAGGTQIESGEVYLINHFGFLGYFLGYENYDYTVTYKKPVNLIASTALKIESVNDSTDVISKQDYDELVDNPVFYTNPDTLSFFVKKTKINITTHSKNQIVTSKIVKPILENVCQNANDFFGEIPVPEYSFFFYFAGHQEKTITQYNSYGALEHNSSSVYFLPEIPVDDYFRSTILEMATHELLHIITPLQLHSKEIHHFDYVEPDMSAHLWLYEGVVEYLSLWLLLTDSLITKEQFVRELRHKLILSEKYSNVSFTEMSKKITKPPYDRMYNNVYNKGALIAFLLDIEINRLTNGKKNLKNIVLNLYEKYKATYFDDDKIIDEIVTMVHPDLESFFFNYVKGSKPLPFEEYMQKIGWVHTKEKRDNTLTFGKLDLIYNPVLNAIVVKETNPKQNMFHFKGGELIGTVNNIEASMDNFNELIEKIVHPATEDILMLEVEKENKQYNMEARPLLMPIYEQHLIYDEKIKTQEQKELHNWIFKKR